MSRPDDDPLALRLRLSGVGPVPYYTGTPVPETEPAPPPEPFAMSWRELREEIFRHSDAGRVLSGVPERDRPWTMVDTLTLIRVETLVVELRRRSGRDSRRLPGIPHAFVSWPDLATLLAPHRYMLYDPPAFPVPPLPAPAEPR